MFELNTLKFEERRKCTDSTTAEITAFRLIFLIIDKPTHGLITFYIYR